MTKNSLWIHYLEFQNIVPIDIKRNRLLKFCCVPTTSAAFLTLLLHPLTVLMRQTRQAERAINQYIILMSMLVPLGLQGPILSNFFVRNLLIFVISTLFHPCLTNGATTPSITTVSITISELTLSIKVYFTTLNINYNQHK